MLNLLLFLIAGYMQFAAVMLLCSMSANPMLVSSAKLLATGDYTDNYTMMNSVNALVMWYTSHKPAFAAAQQQQSRTHRTLQVQDFQVHFDHTKTEAHCKSSGQSIA